MGSSQMNAAFPDITDEPPTFARLYGRNLAPNAEIDGWSHYYAEYFTEDETSVPMDKITEQMIRTYDLEILGTASSNVAHAPVESHDDDDDVMEIENVNPFHVHAGTVGNTQEGAVRAMFNQCVTLSDLFPRKCPITWQQKAIKPVFVTVIEKKRIELVVNRDCKVLIFGQLIVADNTGICIMKFLNLAVQLAYNLISVGDNLIIGTSTLGSGATACDFLPSFGFQHPMLHGVMKLNELDTSKLIRLVKSDTTACISRFFLPTFQRLWTPSSLLQELGRVPEVVDVIGVLSHVSRFERRRRHKSAIVLADGESVSDDFVQFDITSWIELIDKDVKEPVPILLNLTSLLWPYKEQLIPGSLVIITNVGLKSGYTYQEESFATCYQSYQFSQDYLNLRKSDEVESTIKEFVGKANMCGIWQRSDVTWSIGGGYPLPVDPTKFVPIYWDRFEHSNKAQFSPLHIVPSLPLYRRESQLLVFEAALIRYNLYKTKSDYNIDSWTWTNSSAICKHGIHGRRSTETLYDPIPAGTSGMMLWFLWKRQLPSFAVQHVPEVDDDIGRQLKLYQEETHHLEKFARAISMPAGIGKPLRKLPVIDGGPHFAVEVLNKETDNVHLKRLTMTWKPSRNLSIDQIQNKLIELRSSDTVLVIAKIHRTESIGLQDKYGHDFMIHYIFHWPKDNFILPF